MVRGTVSFDIGTNRSTTSDVGFTNPKWAQFRRTGDQTIANNSNVKVVWNSFDGDQDIIDAWSTDKWTCTSALAGVYNISMSSTFAGNATGARQGQIVCTRASSTDDCASWFLPLTGSAELAGGNCACTLELEDGDIIEFKVKQKSGAGLALRSGESVAYMTRITSS